MDANQATGHNGLLDAGNDAATRTRGNHGNHRGCRRGRSHGRGNSASRNQVQQPNVSPISLRAPVASSDFAE